MPTPPNKAFSHAGTPSQAGKGSKYGYQGGKKKPKRGFFGDIGHALTVAGHGGEDISTGLGVGTYELVKAIQHDINKARGASSKTPYETPGIGKAMAVSTMHDIRHPEDNPVSSFLTLGALLAPITKVGTAARAAEEAGQGARLRAATEALTSRRPPIRTYRGIPYRKGAFAPKLTAYKTRNPLFNAIRSLTLEPAYRLSRHQAIEGGRGGGYARFRLGRESEQRLRHQKQLAGAQSEPRPPGVGKKMISTPTNLMRLGMFARPRYVFQNVAGTGIMLGMDQGPVGLARSISMYRHFKKADPGTLGLARNAMGGTGTASLAQEAVGPLTKTVHRTATLVSAPEARMRPLAFFAAARREGFKTPAQIRKLLEQPERYREQFNRIVVSANESVGDYSRIGHGERQFMATQIPIFYPMTKTFTRYAARYPGQYPVQAGFYAQLGKYGKEKQKQQLGDLPYWATYQIPVGKKKGGTIPTVDPTLISPFQPGTDVAREVGQTLKMLTTGKSQISGLNLLRHLGPTPQIALEALAGFQPGTFYPVKEDPFGSFAQTLGPVPFIQALAGHPQTLKSFTPQDIKSALLEYMFGRTVAARNLRLKQTKKQYKREKKVEKRQLFNPLTRLLP